MKKFYGWFLSLALGGTIQAKVVNHYSVNVTAENRHSLSDFVTALSGWNCYASTSVQYSENLRDHKGNLRRIPKKQEHDWSFSFFSEPNVNLNFDQDSLASDPNVDIELTETCSRTTYSTDSEGNRKTDSETVYFTWDCRLAGLPSRAGESRQVECNGRNNSFLFSLNAYLLSAIKDKKFVARFTNLGSSEELLHDFCPGQKKNRKIIRLQQGVGGHAGENDFIFRIDLGNGQTTEVKTETGLLSGEIAVCTPEDHVRVKISAIEKDMLYDDAYHVKTSNSDELDVFVGQSEKAKLTRDRNKWNLFAFDKEKYDSDILISLVDLDPANLTRRSSSPFTREVHLGRDL